MHIEFDLRGSCVVPEGTTPVPGIANHFRLPSGQVVSVQSVVELASGPDADDHRDLGYVEASGLGLFLDLEDRTLSLEPDH